MQAPPGPQRASQRRSPAVEMGQPTDTQNQLGGGISAMNVAQMAPGPPGPRSSSGSARSQQRQVNVSRRPSLHRPQNILQDFVRNQFSRKPIAHKAQESLKAIQESMTDLCYEQPDKQISQIEKSVTHLLVATKQLLETLTQWSRKQATEGEVSDVYVRLGYEFNLACRAFSAIGVETSDLGPVPDLLRAILEDTLSQDASPQSLDKFLPRIRDIIINLLHGLKRKQAKLRSRQPKEGKTGLGGPAGRQGSVASTGSGDTGLTQMLEDAQQAPTSRSSNRRYEGYSDPVDEQVGVPPRSSSVQSLNNPTIGRTGSMPDRESPRREGQRSNTESTSSSSLSSITMQNIPVLPPYGDDNPPPPSKSPPNASLYPPPPPPPKEQDALQLLQRGGDLERRASRRYSAYQIQKHLGGSPNGVPVIPPPQNSPIPNRGRDVRESMNAVRTRGSYQQHNRQRSSNRLQEVSPSRNNKDNLPHRISEEGSDGGQAASVLKPPVEQPTDDSPVSKTPEDKLGPPVNLGDKDALMGATVTGPPSDPDSKIFFGTNGESEEPRSGYDQDQKIPESEHARSRRKDDSGATVTPPRSQQFTPDESPPAGKELTLFLQYKSKIKKFVLSEGYSDLTIGRLQLAFIEKFAWNTHSNGGDLPEIYIQDPLSGIRHELEDLNDVKDRSVLVLNVEVLDEVKKHFDDGLGGIRQMLEGVKGVIDGQETAIQRLSDRQLEAAKDMARLAAAPPPAAITSGSRSHVDTRGVSTNETSMDSSSQVSEIQSLRRDLAVVRQTYSSFVSDITASMMTIRSKASSVKSVAVKASIPSLEGNAGRAHIDGGKKALGEESEKLVGRVDDLQDLVEDLRKDVVTRGVRPMPRQLETVGKDISAVTKELKRMQEFLKREKPIWTKIWEKELQLVCDERDQFTMQEDLALDLQDDLEKATQTFALVEQATKQQMQTGPGGALRNTSRSLAIDQDVDPMKAKDGVLGEVRALQPNHENRLEAIERAEKARRKDLETRQGGTFQKELGKFVDEGKLKKSGGVEEVERLRKAKDERARQENFQLLAQREAEREARKAEKRRQKENIPAPVEQEQQVAGDQAVDDPANGDNEAADTIPELPRIPSMDTNEEPTASETTGTEGKPAGGLAGVDSPVKKRSSWLPAIFSGD